MLSCLHIDGLLRFIVLIEWFLCVVHVIMLLYTALFV